MRIEVESIQTIQRPGTDYVGWPTIGRRRSGELFIVYSGGRRHHVCPFGQVHLIHSNDEGKTWTWPRVIIDGPLDDRDAGILETSKGTLIVNWFSSLTWEQIMDQKRDDPTESAEWRRRHQWLTDEVRRRELGVWCVRSTDGGHTWSGKIDTIAGSPHGPIQLRDGRLLYPGKRCVPKGELGNKGGPYAGDIGASVSQDDGQTWRFLSSIQPMQGHSAAQYHELHGIEAEDGHIVVHIRNHNSLHDKEILQTDSYDGGQSWSPVRSTGIWGFPAFLTRCADGRLLTTFGHRREPWGNQVAVSEDQGRHWSAPMAINTDSQGDMGYPSTVETSPGQFLSLWYDAQGRSTTTLRIARWRLT